MNFRSADSSLQGAAIAALIYARTLDLWAHALQARETEAIELQSQGIYERYMKYLTGCAAFFRSGHIDVNQFTLQK